MDSTSTVLETSCGNGVFIASICNKLLSIGLSPDSVKSHLMGIELVKEEADTAKKLLLDLGITEQEAIIRQGDFFEYCKNFLAENRRFSLITGNPPFIRYQDFPQKSKEKAFSLISEHFDFKLSGHANSWIAFLLLSTQLLSDNGKIAMVIPAQLFQVKYAKDTRCFLSAFFKKLTIITFEKLIFPTAQQEVVLLLGERGPSNTEGIRVIELKDTNDLFLRVRPEEVSKNFRYYGFKPMDHSNEKWTQYYLSVEEIELIRSMPKIFGVKKSKDLFSVDIGVVTGRNRFFILTEESMNNNNLMIEDVVPILGKSADIKGIDFSETDWQNVRSKNTPCFLIVPPNASFSDLPERITNYIKKGIESGVDQGYKCRIRKENWYKVPTLFKPDAFFLRQIHDYPKIVLNSSPSTCTDTIHRLSFKKDVDRKAITVAFLNSLTFASAEINGRSYGGGVLTLEPSESENLLLPITGIEKLDFQKIDNMIRQEKIDEILTINDEILLKEGLGLASEQVLMLRNIWKKLRNRRINRRGQLQLIENTTSQL